MANPELKMYRSDIPTQEVGTLGNPIDFGWCLAGTTTYLAYDILLWNDKGGSLGSEDAKTLEIELLRFSTSQNWASNGNPSQNFTVAYIPTVSDVTVVVTVAGSAWLEMPDFTGSGPTDEHFTFNYTTGVLTFGDGVNGKIPPNGNTIEITYTPDLNTFGKTVYGDQWLSIKSSGVVQNVIHVGSGAPEEATKIDNSTIQILHYPEITEVVGVWDNAGKSGTNYYTGGSFDANNGRIYLGTTLTASTAYAEYKYRIKDDNEGAYTVLGDGEVKTLTNRIPRNNAKRLQLKVDVPATADSEGGAFIKVQLRVSYES